MIDEKKVFNQLKELHRIADQAMIHSDSVKLDYLMGFQAALELLSTTLLDINLDQAILADNDRRLAEARKKRAG